MPSEDPSPRTAVTADPPLPDTGVQAGPQAAHFEAAAEAAELVATRRSRRAAGTRPEPPAGDAAPRPAGDAAPRPAGDAAPRPAGDAAPRSAGRSPGRLGYVLAWLAVVALAVVALLLGLGVVDPGWPVAVAVGVAALLGAAAVHLAAAGLNRRRDVGLSAVAVALVLLLMPALTVAAVVGAALGAGRVGPFSVVVDAGRTDAELPVETDPGPMPDTPLPTGPDNMAPEQVPPGDPMPGDPMPGDPMGGEPLPAEPAPGDGGAAPGTVG